MITFTVDDIKEAIANKDIYLVYQPIVDLKFLEIVAYEALARWKFKGEFISPAVFMGFGDLKVMRSLTQYILSIAEETEKRLNIPIHVNISIYDLSYSINAKVSCLEITEEIPRYEVIDKINRLSTKYQIVIDDFGQKYAGWIDLPYLNISKIKLDKRVIDELILPEKYYYIEVIKTTVKIADKKGVVIVAEGVETEEQLKILRSLNVHQGQGYYFGKPGEINYG